MFIKIFFLLMFFYKNVNISSNDAGVIHIITIAQNKSETESFSHVYDIYPLNLKCTPSENTKDIYIEGEYISIFNTKNITLENSKYCFVIDSYNKTMSSEEITLVEDNFVLMINDILKNFIVIEKEGSWIKKKIEKNNKQINLFFYIKGIEELIVDLQMIMNFHSIQIIKEGKLKKILRDFLFQKQLVNTHKNTYSDLNKISGADYCILNEFIMNMFKCGSDVLITKESVNTFYKGPRQDLAKISYHEVLQASNFIESLVNKEDKKNKIDHFLYTWYPKEYQSVYMIDSENSLIKHYYKLNQIKELPISNEKNGFCLLIEQKNMPSSVVFKMSTSNDKKSNIIVIEE